MGIGIIGDYNNVSVLLIDQFSSWRHLPNSGLFALNKHMLTLPEFMATVFSLSSLKYEPTDIF